MDSERLVVTLEGFEGPLDLLLELARAQKVDLAAISIVALVDQYLAVIETARSIRLELAADWLVMAAWLTWLKSRLLLPASDPANAEGEIAAEVLAARLVALETVRALAAWLGQRSQLGWDVFARGEPEDFIERDRSKVRADLGSLISAYLSACRRGGAQRSRHRVSLALFSIQQALGRLQSLLGSLPDWSTLEAFLPTGLGDPLAVRAALASTLVAGLELERSGSLVLRQDDHFGPILIKQGVSGQRTDDVADE
jgi:segregation and condensation protein A